MFVHEHEHCATVPGECFDGFAELEFAVSGAVVLVVGDGDGGAGAPVAVVVAVVVWLCSSNVGDTPLSAIIPRAI